MDQFHEAVAAVVRGWAAQMNIKQEDIAHVLGIKQQNVSSRMTGSVAFTVDQLHALVTAWGMDPHQLVNESRGLWLRSRMALAADEESEPTEDEIFRREHPDDESL